MKNQKFMKNGLKSAKKTRMGTKRREGGRLNASTGTVRVKRPVLGRVQVIHGWLKAGEFPNCGRIAAEFEMDRKTALRDIEFMKEQMSMPIAYDDKRHGYYFDGPAPEFGTVALSERELFELCFFGKATEQFRGSTAAKPLEALIRGGSALRMELSRLTISTGWVVYLSSTAHQGDFGQRDHGFDQNISRSGFQIGDGHGTLKSEFARTGAAQSTEMTEGAEACAEVVGIGAHVKPLGAIHREIDFRQGHAGHFIGGDMYRAGIAFDHLTLTGEFVERYAVFFDSRNHRWDLLEGAD